MSEFCVQILAMPDLIYLIQRSKLMSSIF